MFNEKLILVVVFVVVIVYAIIKLVLKARSITGGVLFKDKREVATRVMGRLRRANGWVHKEDFYDFSLTAEEDKILTEVLYDLHKYGALTMMLGKCHICKVDNYDKYLDKLRAEENFSKQKAA